MKLFEVLEKEKIVLTDREKDLLRTYAETIKKFSRTVSLTSRKSPEYEIERQFYDAILLNKFLGDYNILLDLGAGAGFVGIVQKILNPDAIVYLVERRKKRIAFLELCLKLLKLKNIFVIDRDWKEIEIEADVAVSKASCGLDELLTLLPRLLKKGGILVHFSSGPDYIERATKFYYYYSPYRKTKQYLYVFQRVL